MDARKASSQASSGAAFSRDSRPDAESVQAAPPAPTLADNESVIAPDIADGVSVRYVSPSAPWLTQVGGDPRGIRLHAGVAARVALLFDDTKADLRHEVEWEAIIAPIADEIDPDDAIEVDYDDRDLGTDPEEGSVYILPEAKIHTKTLFNAAKTRLKDRLYRSESLVLFHNPELKAFSRVGEDETAFAQRCSAIADELADKDVAKLRDSLETKMDRVRVAIDKAEDRVRELEHDADARSKDQVFDIATSVLGSVLGGRRSTRSILGGARRASSRQRTKSSSQERLRTAENRMEEKVDELEDLETELTDSLYEIQADWEERSKEIEVIEVPLEKTDISIDDFTLIWIPTA